MPTQDKSTEREKLLIVEDNDVFREALKISLEDEGYEVVVAESGPMAQELVILGKYLAVISDIRMTPISGIELLHFIKKTNPLPVILMTGFSDLLETQEAFSLGAVACLVKPFKSEELFQILKTLISSKATESPPPSQDDNFCRLNIDDFISGHEIKFDIYIRLSADRYVMIAHHGENIPVDQIRKYKEKGLLFLHMLRDDFKKYVGFNLSIAEKVVHSTTLVKTKKIQFLKHTTDLILEQLHNSPVEQQTLDYASSAVERTISLIADSNDLLNVLSTLNSHADFLYNHSLGVSLYSVMIAKEMGWTAPNNIFKISLGGLLHDIGKKEIDRSILTKARKDLTEDDLTIIKTHPRRGVEILSKLPNVSGDVLQIILQHHECCDGTGYPSMLKKKNIHPLARLISVANEFCNFVVKAPGHPALSIREGIDRLIMLYSRQLDPTFLSALTRLCATDPSKSTAFNKKL